MGLWNRFKDMIVDAPMGDGEEEMFTDWQDVGSHSFEDEDESGAGKLISMHPQSYLEAGDIAERLCQGYTVFLDLSDGDPRMVRRIVDFLSGSVYAKDGQMIEVGTRTYLLTPAAVDILDGEQEETDRWEEESSFDTAFGF